MESEQSPEVEHGGDDVGRALVDVSVESEQSPEVEQARPEPEQFGTVARQSGCGDAPGSLLEPESAVTAELLPAQPDPAAMEGVATTAWDSAPEELANAPVLRWREFDPGVGDVSSLESMGDGRVQALSKHTSEGAVSRIAVTSDGTDWTETEVSMPEGIDPAAVDVSGDL